MKAGLWLPVILLCAAASLRIAAHASVDAYGGLHRAELAAGNAQWSDAAGEARAALTQRPMDGRPYRVLARAAAAAGNSAQADALVAQAVRYAPRDIPTRALAVQVAIAQQQFAQAVQHCDRILRVQPDHSDAVFPILAWLADTPAGRDELARRLEDRPDWRVPIVNYLVRAAPRGAALQPLLHAIGRRSALSPQEMATYIGRFVADQQWNEGYFAWVSELPVERRQLLVSPVDGDFELPLSSGAPFDWQFTSGKGVEVSTVRRSDGDGRALRVAFGGARGEFNGVRQLLLLQPGLEYRLRWQSHAESLATTRGLSWVVRCAQTAGPVLLVTEPLRGDTNWRQQDAAFRVPADCPAQWLELTLQARLPAESSALGAAWFDHVAILSNVDPR